MGGLRVIVGDEAGGPRSQLWRIWTGDKTSDVYVGARPIAGEIRASLHESGRWRFAFTDKHQRRPQSLIGPDVDRARRKWTRPPEFAPGLTRAFVIVIPSSELLEPRGPDPLRKPAVWISPPPPDGQVEIDLFLARGVWEGTWPGQRALATRLLHRQALPNGEDLIVISRVVRTTDERRQRIEIDKRVAVEAQRGVIVARVPPEHRLRGVLFSSPGANPPPDLRGVYSFTDVALPHPSEVGLFKEP